MILVAGGTGLLGTQIVRLLLARGLRVRVLTRDAHRAEHLGTDGLEIVTGDVRDAPSLAPAMAGIRAVVSAIHGFAGPGGVSPSTVDYLGNRNLICAAEAGGASHFVLMSIVGAAPDHPMELVRMKYRAEQLLRGSSLAWTIIRATAYMELWASMIGAPILRNGKTTIFGSGENPINFVSAHDVARFVEMSIVDPNLRGAAIDVGGPDNLTFKQMVQVFERLAGRESAASHVPLPVMRLASALMRPLKPELARQIQAGVVMDTYNMRFDAAETCRRYPAIPLTSLDEMVKRDFVPARVPIGSLPSESEGLRRS